jgi:N-acetylmuramoyl-L-alanine amidase
MKRITEKIGMKKLITLTTVLMLFLAAFAPVVSHAQGYDAYVNTSFLNMRVGPGASYERVATLSQGTTMRLIARDAAGTWVQGVLSTGVSGWVNASYLVVLINIYNLPIGVPSTPSIPAQSAFGAVVNTAFLNLRNGPAANFSIVAKLSRGDQVTLVGRNGDAKWVQVITATNLQGWLSARYLISYGVIANLPITSGTGVSDGFVEPVPTGGSSGIVATAQLNVRTGPSIYFSRFETLPQGTGVNLAGRNATGTWLVVQLADGRTGWVNASYVFTTYPIATLPILG